MAAERHDGSSFDRRTLLKSVGAAALLGTVSPSEAGAAQGGALSALFSTHPADEKRIADLKALMTTVVPVYEKNRGKFSN